MRIGSSFPSFAATGTAVDRHNSGTSFAAVQEQVTAGKNADGATPESGYDFTNISSNQMRIAMNDMISSGKMSLDESTGLVELIPGPLSVVDGNPAVLDQPFDFLSFAQDAIAGARWRSDDVSVAYLTRGLEILSANQNDTV
ncbi:hypothetical protein EPK99_03890 [Neorhizobium lilium]|uniref:Uncharacterized protein n=1 Tax=Neorhizobium lilium TaxID=2503024 RepID=A0A3S4UV08_9HYPH|nr:hypothetical protein [Neorhizobium lilium]RWX81446.1 hypothetical protein EPK99_03890 [Neorhizobium lilium]